MKFNCAALLALASSTTTTIDAFLYPNLVGSQIPSSTVQMVGGWDNDDFLAALSGGNPQAGNPPPQDGNGEEEEDGGQGGSMFKRILEQAKSRIEPGPRPVMNPFLAVPNDPVSPVNNPLELSVEEQARMFREMMKNGGVPAAPMELPAVRRTARTDRAGKPVGRNRDADTIANTADLYFAQLKRDSSVRAIARIQGDYEQSNKVFEDEGIKELETILVKNPYLKGLREKEQALIDTVPEELIKPFFDPDTLPEEQRTTSGVSYKELLKQKRQRQQGGAGLPSSSPQAASVPQPEVSQPPQNYAQTMSAPPQAFIPQPVAPVAQVVPVTPVPPRPPQTQTQQISAAAVSSPMTSSSTSDPEDAKRKIRTFMGMLLKHRGGPGFGKGRLKGAEIEQFNTLLDEVTGMLRAEAAQSTVAGTFAPSVTTQQIIPPPMTTPVVAPPIVTQPVIAASNPPATASPPQLDSMIACVEGAVLMYKNSPMELKSTVMVTLRAALAAAVTTCESVIGSDPNPTPAAASQVDGTIAVIEGAVSMYKNSPPELRSSVLFTLRAALKIAVITCDSLLGTPPATPMFPTTLAAPVSPAPIPQTTPLQTAVSVPAQVSAQPVAQVIPATDRNSKALDEIYQKVSNAAGEGRLGLRSDLTSQEAAELADGLMDMRAILMEELDAGIPDPEPESNQGTQTSTDETVSKYQQMLAKARAEKAGNS